MNSMKRTRFEELVNRAIAGLPQQFLDRLENVAVMVEDRPSAELLERMEIPPDDTLFGLYEGVPLTERGFEAPLYPDRIWIFQEPIERECLTEDEIEKEVQTTIIHEVAHFFGFDDDELEELGY
jgi:predicted Zn-dependent protease with MMP-like domain